MNQAVQTRREGRLADAKRDWTEAFALCRPTGSRVDPTGGLKGLGQSERDLRNGQAALTLYEEAGAHGCAPSEPLLLAHAILHPGDIHLDAARLELTDPCYREALGLCREHEQTAPLDLADAIRPSAIRNERKGEVEEGMSRWEEAQRFYAAVDASAGVAESSRHLAQHRLENT
jgi:hypothetical protein